MISGWTNLSILAGGPVGGFVVAAGCELMRGGAIGQHGPDLARAAARGFKDEVAAVGSPTGAFVAAAVAGEFADLVGDDIHDVDVVIAGRTAPGEGEKLAIGRPRGIDDVAHVRK